MSNDATPEQRRLHRLQMEEDAIGRALREAERSGELQRAAHYGRPLPQDAGWDATPPELRMPFKILKDAGIVPPEVQCLHEIAALQAELGACADDAQRLAIQRQLSDKRQALALRMEKLRLSRTL